MRSSSTSSEYLTPTQSFSKQKDVSSLPSSPLPLGLCLHRLLPMIIIIIRVTISRLFTNKYHHRIHYIMYILWESRWTGIGIVQEELLICSKDANFLLLKWNPRRDEGKLLEELFKHPQYPLIIRLKVLLLLLPILLLPSILQRTQCKSTDRPESTFILWFLLSGFLYVCGGGV